MVRYLLNFVVAACEIPLELSLVSVIGYTNPAIEDTYIMFHCPPGLALNGPESSTCMGNGEWEPDSRWVEFIGKSIVSYYDHRNVK